MSQRFDLSHDLELAHNAVRRTQALGADQVTTNVSRGVQASITRRDGRVEQATESETRGLSISILLDDKWSSHATSDLRPAALDAFLARAVEATRLLEPDPDRRLPERAWCGRGASDPQLDQLDAAWAERTSDDRSADAEALEREVAAAPVPDTLSSTVSVGDGFSATARVTSDGFADATTEAWFMTGGECTILDGERRPEAGSWYGTRYKAALPPFEQLAAEIAERVSARIGTGPIASGTYPLVLVNRAAGKLLGLLGGPLAGSSLHEGRSCFAERLDTPIGSELLTLVDDPLMPRALGSRPWDGDGLMSRPRTIVENGVLRSFYMNVYYARKLGKVPTTGGRSNWVVPAGLRPWTEIIRDMPTALVVDGFLGGNANSATGDFSFGVQGALYERGERVRAISEMNVSGNVLEVFHRLIAVGNDPWHFSSVISPALVLDGISFSGTG